MDPLIFILLGGLGVASFYDLKTTEVPNWVFYLTALFAFPFLLHRSLLDFSFLLASLQVGLLFSAFGFLMYKLGQWGGADACLLALVGFLIPQWPKGFFSSFPFPLCFLLNLFILGAAYLLAWSLVLAKKRRLTGKIFQRLRGVGRFALLLLVFAFICFFFLLNFFLSFFEFAFNFSESLILAFSLSSVVVGFFVLLKFASEAEKILFKKRISVEELRVGDMLLERRELKGITQKELQQIKASGKKFVWVKEGVRFAPVFPLALVFTLWFGDLIPLLLIS